MSKETEIVIERIDGKLSGSLLMPERPITPSLSIIVSGSGPIDRNGNQAGLHNDSLKKLATCLFENNCATFRFDKRGIGQSVFPSLTESDLTIDVYVRDILAIAETLRHDYGFRNINLIGHSEGGIIALLAAQKMQVDKLVLLATPAIPMSESLIKQYRERAPEFADDVEAALASIKSGHAVRYSNEHIEMAFRPSVIPYIASCFFIEPTRIATSLNQTVHVIQGDNDVQVSAENGEVFREALGRRARVTRCEDMNHVLVKTPRELEENLASYNNPLIPLHHQLENAILTILKPIKSDS